MKKFLYVIIFLILSASYFSAQIDTSLLKYSAKLVEQYNIINQPSFFIKIAQKYSEINDNKNTDLFVNRAVDSLSFIDNKEIKDEIIYKLIESLIELNYTEAAVSCLDLFDNKDLKDIYTSYISENYAKKGKFDTAIKLAKSIYNDIDKSSSLMGIIKNLCDNDMIDTAVSLLSEMDIKSYYKSWSEGYIGFSYYKNKNIKSSFEYLSKASESSKTIVNTYRKYLIQTEIAGWFIQSEIHDSAETIFNKLIDNLISLEEPYDKIYISGFAILTSVNLSNKLYFNKFYSVFKDLCFSEKAFDAYTYFASELINQGNIREGKNILNLAIETARSFSNDASYNNNMEIIIKTLCELNMISDALSLTETLTQYDASYYDIAIALAKNKQYDKAVALSDLMDNEGMKYISLKSIFNHSIKNNDIKTSTEIFERLMIMSQTFNYEEDFFSRQFDIADGFVKLKKFDNAHKQINTLLSILIKYDFPFEALKLLDIHSLVVSTEKKLSEENIRLLNKILEK